MFSCRKQKLKVEFVSNKQNLYFPLPSGLGRQSLRLIPGSFLEATHGLEFFSHIA